MRAFVRCVCVGLIVLASWAAPAGLVGADNRDSIADHVLGQANLTTGTENTPNLGRGMSGPNGAAVDSHSGRLYVADNGNNRVLSWPNAESFANGQAADLVIGQPNTSTNDFNHGGLNERSLWDPEGLAVDAAGNLYVADTLNNRVLIYDAPLATHAAASVVLGQPNFFTNTGEINIDGASLSFPSGVAVDAAGFIYVSDEGNNRVKLYQPNPANNASTAFVIGQPSVFTNTANNGGISAHSLSSPESVTLDSNGSLYVADTGNNRVLGYFEPEATDFSADALVGQNSMVTNTANYNGLGAYGLNLPSAVAMDSQDKLYVADQGNNRVLMFTDAFLPEPPADMVFGQPDTTTDDANHGGSVTASTLAAPSALALDSRGDLFVADFDNNRVVRYDTPANRTSPAVTGLSPSTIAAKGGGFTLTLNGKFFVEGAVVKWNGSPRPTTYLGPTQIQATISAADVAAGGSVAITAFNPAPGGGDSGPVDLPYYGRVTQDTVADLEFGQPGFSTRVSNDPDVPVANQISQATGVALDPRSGRLFEADRNDNRVLSWPDAASMVNGQAADLVIGQPNFFSTEANHGGRSARSLDVPSAVAVDAQGNLYVTDQGNNRVLVYAPPLSSGMAAHLVFGQGGDFTAGDSNHPLGQVTAGSLYGPAGVAVDAQGNLYISDFLNSRILEYNAPLTGGNANRVFGQPSFVTSTSDYNGVTPISLSFPRGLALDVNGNLFVGDVFNARVLEYFTPLSSDTAADLVIGQPNLLSNTVSSASATSLNQPFGVAVDAHGNLFIADASYNRVTEYDGPLATHSAAQRVFGQPDLFTSTPNTGGVSRFSLGSPGGVALDGVGNLYIADSGNGRVLEYDLPLPFLDFVPVARR